MSTKTSVNLKKKSKKISVNIRMDSTFKEQIEWEAEQIGLNFSTFLMMLAKNYTNSEKFEIVRPSIKAEIYPMTQEEYDMLDDA